MNAVAYATPLVSASVKTSRVCLRLSDRQQVTCLDESFAQICIMQVKTSFPRTKLQKRSTEMGHPEAAVHLTTPQGKQAVIHALAEKKRWIAEHSNGESCRPTAMQQLTTASLLLLCICLLVHICTLAMLRPVTSQT